MRDIPALIIAAGHGSRLHPFTQDTPKPLLKLRGRPLINHVLDGLFAAGVRDTTIVIGYEGGQIRRALANVHPCGMRVRFVENPSPSLGNAHSIWSAREVMSVPDGFVLAMADHIVEAAIVRAVTRGAADRTRLAIDRACADDPRAGEATLALVEGDRIIDLGKRIPVWNALDTGVFWCGRRVFDVMSHGDARLHDGEAGAVFATLARRGELDAVDVTGARWTDVDTEDDLRNAEALLAPPVAVRLA